MPIIYAVTTRLLPQATRSSQVVAGAAADDVLKMPGEVIVSENEPSDRFYIVTEGEVELLITSEEGWERQVDKLGPSRFFGELGILTGKNPATARATKHTELIALDAHSFTELMKRDAVVREDVEADMKRLHDLKYAISGAAPAPAPAPNGG